MRLITILISITGGLLFGIFCCWWVWNRGSLGSLRFIEYLLGGVAILLWLRFSYQALSKQTKAYKGLLIVVGLNLGLVILISQALKFQHSKTLCLYSDSQILEILSDQSLGNYRALAAAKSARRGIIPAVPVLIEIISQRSEVELEFELKRNSVIALGKLLNPEGNLNLIDRFMNGLENFIAAIARRELVRGPAGQQKLKNWENQASEACEAFNQWSVAAPD